MLTLHPKHLIYQAVEFLGNYQPIPEVTFSPLEVVVVCKIETGLAGALLRVPPKVCAVLWPKDGRPQVYGPGKHLLRLPPGVYPLYFVDMRRQSTQLVIQAATDGWEVKLTVQVVWEVKFPPDVINAPRLQEGFLPACIGGGKNFIQATAHDQLVGAPGIAPVSDAAIAEAIRGYTRHNRACDGFEVLDVTVLARQGDRRRVDELQKASVEKIRIEQSIRLADQQEAFSVRKVDQEAAIQKAKLQQEKRVLEEQLPIKEEALRQEVALLAGKATVGISEARAAREQTEERERVRPFLAEMEAKAAEHLRASQLQAVEIQQLRDMLRWEQEYRLKYLETQGKILGQLSSTIMQAQLMPGMQRGVDGDSLVALTNILQAFVQGMPISPPAPAKEVGTSTLQTGLASLPDSLAVKPAAPPERSNGHGLKSSETLAA